MFINYKYEIFVFIIELRNKKEVWIIKIINISSYIVNISKNRNNNGVILLMLIVYIDWRV